ncbi:MAG: RES domain-containing protein [Xanthomonadales bacterium]|nr:RES domain-containing protein [Xanthomonadales bacterium]
MTHLTGPAHFYRAHAPEWASQPLSGAGAAKVGGRLNRKGMPRLYLSDSIETAIPEYQQFSPLIPPLTLVTYEVVRGTRRRLQPWFRPRALDSPVGGPDVRLAVARLFRGQRSSKLGHS